MTIVIPVWLLWVLGIFFGIIVLFLALVGVWFLYTWGNRGGICW